MQILISLGVFLISFVLGKKVFVLFKFDAKSVDKIETFLFSLGLGLGCLIYIVTIMGVLGLFYSWLFKLFFILTVVLIIIKVFRKEMLRNSFNSLKSAVETMDIFEKICLIVLVILLLYVSAKALKPEIYSDALRYHLYVPKKYIQHHRIFHLRFIPFSNFPFNMEMLYTMGLMLNGQIVAKLINFGMSLALLIAIYSFCRKYFSPKAGIIACLIFYTTPTVNFNAITANSDIGVTFFSFLCIYSILKWLEYKNSNLLIMSAMFGSLALGSKYSALYVIVAVLFLIARGSGLNIKKLFKNECLFLLIIFMITSIWWIKAYIFTGNPVYPFLNKFFKSPFWWQGFNDWFNFSSFGKDINLENILRIPWDITFGAKGCGERNIGLFYLFFVPIGIVSYIFSRPRSAIVENLLIFIAIYFLLWVFTVQYVRYLLPMLTICSIVASYGIWNLLKCRFVYRPLVEVVLVSSFIAAMPIFDIGKENFKIGLRNPFNDLFEDKEKYLSENIADYNIIRYINKNLDKDSRILEIKVQENYYYYNCDMVRLYQFPFNKIIYEHISEDELFGLMQSLGRDRVNYILVNLDDIAVKKAMNSQESPLFRIKKEELFSDKSYKLYKVDPFSLY